MGNFKTWASLPQLHSVFLMASPCYQYVLRNAHSYTHTTLSKSLWKTRCVYCTQFPSLHFLFSTNFEEKILCIWKSPFREGCSSSTILKTVRAAKEEQITVCGMFRPLLLAKKPSEERWNCSGGITHACSEAMETSESQDYCKTWELGGCRKHLIHSLRLTDEIKTREMESLAQSHTQPASESALFSKYHVMTSGASFLWGRRTVQLKQHLWSTWYIQSTSLDATEDTKLDEMVPASTCLWKPHDTMFQYFSKHENTD